MYNSMMLYLGVLSIAAVGASVYSIASLSGVLDDDPAPDDEPGLGAETAQRALMANPNSTLIGNSTMFGTGSVDQNSTLDVVNATMDLVNATAPAINASLVLLNDTVAGNTTMAAPFVFDIVAARWVGVGTLSGMALAALLHGQFITFVWTSPAFVAFMPTTIMLIFQIALLRLHEVTWTSPTKQDDPTASQP